MRTPAFLVLLGACGSAASSPATPGNQAAGDEPTPVVPVAEVGVVHVIAAGPGLALYGGVMFEGVGPGAGDEVDLVDCGGWLGRVRLVSADADPIGWKAEIVESAPAAAPAPCRTADPRVVFAIAPADASRQDARPADLATWTGAGTPAIWADLDGDGAIDLVEIEGLCKPHDDYVCGTISVLEAGRWREVGRTTPL